ncbi:MAG: DNA-directed RNA polymerase subunit omega [Pseudomonadota bacterium]
MARITVEDCLVQVGSRFELVNLAIKRVKQLRAGKPALVSSRNMDIVVALREIAAAKVTSENVEGFERMEVEPRIEELHE